MVKKTYERVEQVVNMETGVMVEETKIFTQKVHKDKFMLVYLENNIAPMFKLKSAVDFKVLLKIWGMSEFATNKIILIKPIKKQIAEELSYGYKTVENSISKLSKKNLLISKGSGLYYLNPEYFFKGSELDRKKAIKIIFQYDIISDEDADELKE